jgi:hypothetical protein
MVMRAIEVVPSADTESQGDNLRARIRDELGKSHLVVISFFGIETATSSFVNACFVPLLSDFSFDEIKARIRIIESTRQINEMIKSRLVREAGSYQTRTSNGDTSTPFSHFL